MPYPCLSNLTRSANKYCWVEKRWRHGLPILSTVTKGWSGFDLATVLRRAIHRHLLPRAPGLPCPCVPSPSSFPIKFSVWQVSVLYTTEPQLLPQPTAGLTLTSAGLSMGHHPPHWVSRDLRASLEQTRICRTLIWTWSLIYQTVSILLPTSHSSLNSFYHFLLSPLAQTRFLSCPRATQCCWERMLTGVEGYVYNLGSVSGPGIAPRWSHRDIPYTCPKSSNDYQTQTGIQREQVTLLNMSGVTATADDKRTWKAIHTSLTAPGTPTHIQFA